MAKAKQDLIAEVNGITPVTPESAIASLIVKLSNDVTSGRTRDEFKTLDAIAKLYTAISVTR